MTTTQIQTGVASVANEVLRNLVAIADVIAHAGPVLDKTDDMAKLLGKARRLDSTAPASAAKLRAAARKIDLM